ncbi:hypothetical protein [Photobacterium sp. Hal280]|uniref:hypothetical protein n=1 Tax=Photobacterium sp. Hal280 TaxID=3035163 RepID=UPI00301DB790
MATESLTRCYRFARVDFEPDLRLLVWPDKSETALTLHESRLLEALCYFAGEVISHKSLSDKTFLPQDSMSHIQKIDLASIFNSLRRKLTVNGVMAIPIEVLPILAFASLCRKRPAAISIASDNPRRCRPNHRHSRQSQRLKPAGRIVPQQNTS